jgi:type I restriction enzyme M protein
MANERHTEELTKTLLQFVICENDFGYCYTQGCVTDILAINQALNQAGGKPPTCELADVSQGGNGKAQPEFILTFKQYPDTIIVIECKKLINKHRSAGLNKPAGYAIDGALYYAKFLKNNYNIIAIGISGTDKNKLLIDVFYWQKQQDTPVYQHKLHNQFLTPLNYLKFIKGEKFSKAYSLDEIRDTAIVFHDKLREIKLTERQKPIFIAGILIALEDSDFLQSYNQLPSFNAIITQLNGAIQSVLKNSDIIKHNIDNINIAFTVIGTNPKLKEIPLTLDGSIRWYIEQLEIKIKPMMSNADFSLDALGVFYHEFVKYSGGDGSGLGIVLTPQHLTEFMCEVAGINKKSRVVDICCGSGSFLVTAMATMFKETADPDELTAIRQNLFGVELDQDLYILAIANMIIRKDGKSNILHGDCFASNIFESIKNKKPEIGLLNPPYSQKDKEELEFVEQLLALLTLNGTGVVVVPMSCAIGTKFQATRQRLFEKHTLRAVFSMPDEIFYPTATNVCVMVWTAHCPHKTNTKTFFGYYKDDGFLKKKKLGRIDAHQSWNTIKQQWLQLYRNSEIMTGLTAKHAVTAQDEWLCEAYLETDYSKITQTDFAQTVRNYLGYLVMCGKTDLTQYYLQNHTVLSIDFDNWQLFRIGEFFNITRGKRIVRGVDYRDKRTDEYQFPVITATTQNNGVDGYYSTTNCNGNLLVSGGEASGMFTTYHADSCWIMDRVRMIVPKQNTPLNKYIGLFLATLMSMNQYKYSYGRSANPADIANLIIKLPITPNNTPDWQYMEDYIKQLPYSDRI